MLEDVNYRLTIGLPEAFRKIYLHSTSGSSIELGTHFVLGRGRFDSTASPEILLWSA